MIEKSKDDLEEKAKRLIVIMMDYLSLSRWQLANNVEVEIGFGLFQSKQAALEYADEKHSDLFEMDNSFVLTLESGEFIFQEDLNVQFYEVKKESQENIFLAENDYDKTLTTLETLKKKVPLFKNPIPLSYHAKPVTQLES